MKQIFTAIVMLACVTAGYAQKKPNPSKAKSAMEKGELAEAKAIIDQAIVYEKTMDKAKTWYYRGMIYAVLDTTANEPGAMETAIASFNKALELDPQQKTTTELTGTSIITIDNRLQSYYSHYYLKAVDSYQTDDFKNAADNFEKAFYIMPSDSNSVLNAAYSAMADDDDERAVKNLEKAIDLGVKNRDIYLTLYNYAVQDQDLDRAMSVIKASREVYPDDVELQKFEINILIDQDKVDEAKAGIEEAIEKEPNNADLHFSLGVIADQEGEKEAAMESYNRALAADPDHYNANYNLGALIFNEANKLLKERNELSYKEEDKFEALDKQINEQLENAMPFFEKVYGQDAEDKKILELLEYIYTSLDMKDKAARITAEIEGLGAN